MKEKEMEKLILKNALLNAIKYDGKANQGSIISKLLGEMPELKDNIKDVAKQVGMILKDVNKMTVEEQTAKLEEIAPGALDAANEKKEKKHDIFEFLGIKEGDKIVTSFPPGPEKYPHIGHGKACLINFALAKKYNGKFILRFEDTNPKTVRKKYYDMMLQDLKWLGMEWDELYYASDYMDMYYSKAEDLIKRDHAYVCTCDLEQIKQGRAKGTPCDCRLRNEAANLVLWKQMFILPPEGFEEGKAILRLRIDLTAQNSVMRDPTIFRIIEHEHARFGKKYRVWPSYDFQTSIIDGHFGVTHRIRSKEFEMRNELQRYIQYLLDYKETKIYEMARFNIEGVEASGRKIRALIEEGKLVGWDDPCLTTLAAMRRRGFQPEAIRNFLFATGITKHESLLSWDDVAVHNRRLLDPKCNRYFFIKDPVHITIKGAPEGEAHLHKHPDFKERGERKFETHEDFIITPEDNAALKEGHLYRLMDCINFEKFHNTAGHGEAFRFHSKTYAEYKNKGAKIMHWLPYDSENKKKLVDVSIMMPDKTVIKGLAESGVTELKVDEIIQFERFGFCRLDEIKNAEGNAGSSGNTPKEYVFWFTHR